MSVHSQSRNWTMCTGRLTAVRRLNRTLTNNTVGLCHPCGTTNYRQHTTVHNVHVVQSSDSSPLSPSILLMTASFSSISSSPSMQSTDLDLRQQLPILRLQHRSLSTQNCVKQRQSELPLPAGVAEAGEDHQHCLWSSTSLASSAPSTSATAQKTGIYPVIA